MIHNGGDSGTISDYRKGILYFYNNTVISTRTGNTTLIRLSTNEETAQVFNNILYTSASGNRFAMISGNGTFNMHHNWLKTGWRNCHCTPNGVVNDQGNNLTGSDLAFRDFLNQLFNLQDNSFLIDKGDIVPAVLLPDYNLSFEYLKHQDSEIRLASGNLDIGAFENTSVLSTDAFETENYILIVPNPATDKVNIDLKGEALENVIIYNNLGQQIKKITSNQVDISNLSKGIYFIKI